VESFEYVSLFTQLAPRIGSFIDVGANIGLYSLLAAEFGLEVKVLALEPSTGPLHFLLRNVGLARYKERIKVLPIAASNKSGITVFNEVRNAKYPFTQYHLNGDGGFIPHSAKQNSMKVQVRMEPLDAIIGMESFGGVDLIKIDTEGTENDVLAGAMDCLRRDLPIVICEMLFDRIEGELESIMKPLGYQFYSHTHAGLVLRPTLMRKDDDGVSNVFFVHPSKMHLVSSFIVHGAPAHTSPS
jgi:FkbM family methyltransferase